MRDAAQLINQTSGDVEYYTPPDILAAARSLLGHFDLDPASSAKANQSVLARTYFTEQDNALHRPWRGLVWMNHPFGRLYNKAWIEKFVSEYCIGNMTEGLSITFASTSEAWFQPLLKYPQCFLSPRTNYLSLDGTVKQAGATKGSVVTYLGNRSMSFAKAFERLGITKVRIV